MLSCGGVWKPVRGKNMDSQMVLDACLQASTLESFSWLLSHLPIWHLSPFTAAFPPMTAGIQGRVSSGNVCDYSEEQIYDFAFICLHHNAFPGYAFPF